MEENGEWVEVEEERGREGKKGGRKVEEKEGVGVHGGGGRRRKE